MFYFILKTEALTDLDAESAVRRRAVQKSSELSEDEHDALDSVLDDRGQRVVRGIEEAVYRSSCLL